MKTKSVNAILNHKFFLYGMVFLSVMQLLNFYNAGSLSCLGVFGLTYYVSCMYTKNKALCLLSGVIVSQFVLGCEKNLEGFKEGAETHSPGDGHTHPEGGPPEGGLSKSSAGPVDSIVCIDDPY